MKRVKGPKTYHLPPVVLFKEDIEWIAELLGGNQNIDIHSGEYEYENLRELEAQAETSFLERLRMQRSSLGSNFISVDIEPSKVHLYTGSKTDGRAAQIVEFLRDRSPWYSYVGGPWWYGLTGLVGALFLITGSAFVLIKIEETWLTIFGIALVNVATWAPAWREKPWLGGSRIYLRPKVAYAGFLERNKDSLIVNLIVAIVSALVGYVLGQL